MTILTKPSDVKKPEKTVLVPPTADFLETGATTPLPEGRGVVMIRSRRASSQATTLLLFLIAVLVMCIGIIGGVMIYRQFAMQRWTPMRFHGLCRIPYDTEMMDRDEMLAANREFLTDGSDDQDTWLKLLVNDLNTFAEKMLSEAKDVDQGLDTSDSDESVYNTSAEADRFLQEEFELGMGDDENYSKINVPKLITGKSATFLHDFKAEQTGIIDKAANRCFVMPLDREALLPPQDFVDLIVKMRNGYYNINTDVLRKNMRVKLPAITDMSTISPRVANECKGMNVYELEKIVSGVAKRSTKPRPDAYAEFAGKNFNEYHIMNSNELDALEKDHN
jgi:integral membrane protein 2B